MKLAEALAAAREAAGTRERMERARNLLPPASYRDALIAGVRPDSAAFAAFDLLLTALELYGWPDDLVMPPPREIVEREAAPEPPF